MDADCKLAAHRGQAVPVVLTDELVRGSQVNGAGFHASMWEAEAGFNRRREAFLPLYPGIAAVLLIGRLA